MSLTLLGCASLDDYVDISGQADDLSGQVAPDEIAASQATITESSVIQSSTPDVGDTTQREPAETGSRRNAHTWTIATDPTRTLSRVADETPTGLTLVGGWLLESAGVPGSTTRKLVDPRDGTVVSAVAVGEGRAGGDVTDLGGRAVQLLEGETYALVIDPATLAEIDRLPLDGPSHGICSDGEVFITSDRSDVLTVIDTNGLRVGQLALNDPGGLFENTLTGVDRLACTADVVVATIWASHVLVAFDRETGSVLTTADLAHLSPSTISVPDDFEHGISAVALDDTGTLIYVTGRGWDRIQLLELTRS